jgi:TRAP-type mannitol/chloroaromatic compound transport system permease large subunit
MWGALAMTMLVMFIMGFFLDFIEIVFVVVPLVAPPLIILGADPVWLAILMALNLQTSFLTPPFGFALFYLRGAAPNDLATIDIWRGAIPFIGLQVLLIALVAAVPAIATWLPGLAAS